MENTGYCVFCRIAGGQGERILFQDELVVVFEDLHPAAKHHYLVCPRQHIPNAKRLASHDLPLVEHMLSVGKGVLQQQQADVDKARFGFHWPPFCSVYHLHLHAISPYDRIKPLFRVCRVFSHWTPWFKSVNWVIRRLKASGKKSLKTDADPATASTNAVPANASTNAVPVNADAVSVNNNANAVPANASTNAVPANTSTNAVPTNAVPANASTNAVPANASTNAVPANASTIAVPANAVPPELSSPSNDVNAAKIDEIHQENRIELPNTGAHDQSSQN